LHPETLVSRHFDSELISCTLKPVSPVGLPGMERQVCPYTSQIIRLAGARRCVRPAMVRRKTVMHPLSVQTQASCADPHTPWTPPLCKHMRPFQHRHRGEVCSSTHPASHQSVPGATIIIFCSNSLSCLADLGTALAFHKTVPGKAGPGSGQGIESRGSLTSLGRPDLCDSCEERIPHDLSALKEKDDATLRCSV